MTNEDITPIPIFLDHYDMDGLISIAKYGIKPFINSVPTIELVNKLAATIAQYAIGQAIEFEQYNADTAGEFDENDPNILEGQAVLTVTPLHTLRSLGE